MLLDCGPGSLGPLQEAIDFADLTAVVVTHCHPDHWLELPVIRNVYKWFHPRDDGPLPVYGTAETGDMYRALCRRAGGEHPEPLAWHVVDGRSDAAIGDQRWRFSETDHTVETLAVRVDAAGRSFAFSADTGPGWDFRSLGEGIDVALCEASHSSESEGLGISHMSARQAALAAAAAGIGRLVLTHIAPVCDPAAQRLEAGSVFDGSVDVARPGLVLAV